MSIRTVSTAVALAALAVLLGCSDGGEPVPQPSDLEEQAAALFPAGGAQDEARDLAAEVVTSAGQGNSAAAAAAAFELTSLTLAEYYGGRLPATLNGAPGPLDNFISETFDVAGLGDPGLEAASFSDDGLVAVVHDTGGLFVTATQHAGIQIPSGAVPGTTLLAIRRLPDSSQFAPKDGPLPTDLDQYPFFYDFGFTPDVTLSADGIIGLCQLSDPNSAYYPPDFLFDILQIAHPDPDDRSTIELLELVDAPFLNCDGTTTSVLGAKSLAQRRSGIGGRVRKFSPFAAVDPLQSLSGFWEGSFRAAGSTTDFPVSFTLVEGAGGAISGTYVLPGTAQLSRTGTMTGALAGRTVLTWTMTNAANCPGSWSGQASVNATGEVITTGFSGSDCATQGATVSGVATTTRQAPGQPVTITTASLPGGTVTQAYFAQLAATGGTGTYSWSISSGTLPGGLTLNGNNGIISGTPTFFGSFPLTIVAQSGAGAASREYTLVVSALGNVQLGLTLQGAGTGTVVSTPGAISCERTSTGQTGTCSASFGMGSMVSLAATPSGSSTFGGWGGACSGTAGTCQVTLNAATTVTATFTAPAQVTVTTTALPGATVGVAYNATLQATGGTGTYTWSVPSGALPAGVTLNQNTGVVSGVPTVAGATSFTVRATSGSQSGERGLGILVSQASGGNVRLTLTVFGAGVGGTVTSSPAGIGCNLFQGLVSGSCAADFPSGSTVTLSYAPPQGTGGLLAGWSGGGCTGSGPCQFTIASATTIGATFALPLTISPTLPLGALGAAYSGTLLATGGTSSKSWSLVSGTLPAGLSLQSSGAITGTPTAEGTFGFTVRVTSLALTAERLMSLVVGALIVVDTDVSQDRIFTAQNNNLRFVVNPPGGTYTWSIVAGALPPGLTLNTATGGVTGQATTAGTYPVTIRAVNATQTIETSLTLQVLSNPCPAGQFFNGSVCLF